MRAAVGHLLLRTSHWGAEAVVELLVAVRKKMEKEMVVSSYREEFGVGLKALA
jgi:hypothetical protein